MYSREAVSSFTHCAVALPSAMASNNRLVGAEVCKEKRSERSVEVVRNGPTAKIGGGFDVVLTRPFAWRLVDIAYSHAWMSDSDMIHPQNTFRISTGAVLRIGTW